MYLSNIVRCLYTNIDAIGMDKEVHNLQIIIISVMNIQNFIENFAAQFDDTDASMLSVETKFKELDEWSSLIALSVIAMVDEEYDITISGDDIRNSNTIEDLFNAIQSKK